MIVGNYIIVFMHTSSVETYDPLLPLGEGWYCGLLLLLLVHRMRSVLSLSKLVA